MINIRHKIQAQQPSDDSGKFCKKRRKLLIIKDLCYSLQRLSVIYQIH